MHIIKPGTKIDFVGKQKGFLLFSAVLVLASLGLIFGRGLNFGVDFKGGSEIVLKFNEETQTEEVRDAAKNAGFGQADVQTLGFGGDNRFLLRVPNASFINAESSKKLQADLATVGEVKKYQWSEEGGDVVYVRFTAGEVDDAKLKSTLAATKLGNFAVTKRGNGNNVEYKLTLDELQTVLGQKLAKEFPASKFDIKSSIERVETVGPRVGQQLRNTGLLSILLAILFILIYIAFRFDVRYAPGAVVALMHDVIITLGVYAAGQFEVSLPIIAALLTIVGYSLNDTIVVFDRIRENITGLPDRPIREIVNLSVNDSLSRTVLTSVTTLLAVLALFGLGGGLVQNFSGAMIVGVVVGTYSSTFVASPVLIFMHEWLEKRRSNRPAPITEPSEEIPEV